jgi:hypothetical protein
MWLFVEVEKRRVLSVYGVDRAPASETIAILYVSGGR